MTTGILPFETLKHLVHLNTGFFECSAILEDDQMKVIAGNWDGAGCSAGNLQYNFGAANRLTELWQFMINNHEAVCSASFADFPDQYLIWKTAMMGTQADRINWGAEVTDPDNGHRIVDPYKTCLGNLMITNECKAKYYEMRDKYYWVDPYDLFRQMSCKSRLALASFFDVFVNKGRYYPINSLQVDFENIDNNPDLSEEEKEAQKIYQINIRGNEEENALNDTSSLAFDDRRLAMANQTGDYYGLLYDPGVQFDMNQETAIEEKLQKLNIKLGAVDVQNVFLGTDKVEKIYLGADLLASGAAYTTSKAPQTQLRTNPNSYAGIGAATDLTLLLGQPLYIDVQNFVACKTYYTTDGSTPTENSAVFQKEVSFNESCIFKALTVSIFGVAEAVKTLNITIVEAPTTTISPAATVQNAIPITVTLTSSEPGAAIHYKLGNSATIYNYSAPFTVNQTSPGVLSPNIKITYWSVGANATEAEKTITYNTSGAIPGTPAPTATPGINQVALTWAETINTTSYSVYRSTAAGTLGTAISQWKAENYFTDLTAVPGTTYYYTVQAGNYATARNSTQVTATATAAPSKPTVRYIKIEGFGENTAGSQTTNTRMVEVEIFSGGVNRAANKPVASQGVHFGGEVGSTAPTQVTDGTKGITSGTYNGWWSVTPNAHVVIDLGAAYPIDSIRYWAYVSRAPCFRIFGSNNAADLPAGIATVGGGAVLLWDEQTNTTKIAGATAGTNNYIEKVF